MAARVEVEARRVFEAVSDVSSERISELSAGSADIKNQPLSRRSRRSTTDVAVAAMSPTPLRYGPLALISGLMMLCMLRLPRAVGQTASGLRRLPASSPATKAAKGEELLEVLGRREWITVAGVALETSLTVEETNRMLSELTAKGQLEVTIEHGRRLYSLWERRAGHP